MFKKRLISLVVASLTLVALGLGGVASSAMAEVHVLEGKGGTETGALRDDLIEPPEHVSGGGYGTSILGTNSLGAIRLTIGEAFNENAANYAYFGVKIHSNPEAPEGEKTKECKEGKGEAEGWVSFVDIQNAKDQSAVESPAYANTSPGYNGEWPIGIKSDKCKNNPGKVTIEHVALYFPKLSAEAVGVLVGAYSEPNKEKCSGGGIELTEAQTLTVNGTATAVKLNNGTAGKPAFICFVSANNYLFPEKAPTWTPLTGEIKKN
jgi:hypothetical protein